MSTINAIYGARKSAALDDELARDIYERETGKRSLKAMTPGEQNRVLDALNRLSKPPLSKVEGPYAKKLIALWLDGWNLGVFADRRDESLIAFVKRQTHVDHTRFLRDAKQAQAVVEALKSWLAREAGVDWGEHINPIDDVIAAQVVMLRLAEREAAGEDGPEIAAFRAWRLDELGRADKIGMTKLLGATVRRSKPVRVM